MIKAICCVDSKWSLGKDNDLLFHLPTDLKQFKLETSDSVVVCGRKTLEGLPGGKPLKNRSTICLCSKENKRDDCFCVHSFEECLKLVKELSKTQTVWIIGGAKIYKSFLPYCSLVLVTKVEADGNGTVFFPNLDEDSNFELVWTSDPRQDNGYSLTFNTYERK